MRFAALSLSSCILASQASAQSGLQWSLATGPTVAQVNTNAHTCPDGCTLSLSGDRVITGAERGEMHAALGVSRGWAGTALRVRAEALFNRSESPLRKSWPALIFGGDTLFPNGKRQRRPD